MACQPFRSSTGKPRTSSTTNHAKGSGLWRGRSHRVLGERASDLGAKTEEDFVEVAKKLKEFGLSYVALPSEECDKEKQSLKSSIDSLFDDEEKNGDSLDVNYILE